MSRKTPWIAGVVVVVLVLGGFAAGWLSPGAPLEAARVRQGPIEQFVDEQAVTRLPQTHLLTMPVAGRIEAITLQEGTRVKQGDPVARLVPRDMELAVREVQSMIDRLTAAVAYEGDLSVEQIGLDQARKYVQSMVETVNASNERVVAGQAKVDYTEKAFGRTKSTFDRGATTQDELDRTWAQKVTDTADLRQSQFTHAAIQAMQAATNLMPQMILNYMQRKLLNRDTVEKQKIEVQVRLERALLDLQRSTMTSPIDGVILKRFVNNELFLPAGANLLEIGRLEDMEVEIDVLTLDVMGVRQNSPVVIYGPAVGEPPAQGRVKRIYPAGFTKVSSLGVEQQRVKVIVGFDPAEIRRLLADRRLGVGYRVRARISVDAKSSAIVVPRSSLFRNPDGVWEVFVVRGGRIAIQELKIGILNDVDAEVLSGLDADELVVVAPERNLFEGQRVRPYVRNRK